MVIKPFRKAKISRICHRDNNKPSFVEYYRSGQIQSETYCKNGKYYSNKPMKIEYYENGGIKFENHLIDNEDGLLESKRCYRI